MTRKIPLVVSGVMAALSVACGLGPPPPEAETGVEVAEQALECVVTAKAELCDGLDNDCNGSVDEGCLCRAGTVVACCAGRGTQSCMRLEGVLGVCTVTAAPETCNGVDDDCDGQIDENLRINCAADTDGDGFAASTTPVPVCPSAQGTCPPGFMPVPQPGPNGTQPQLDCDDLDPNAFFAGAVHPDADKDRHCTMATQSACIGHTAPNGFQFPSDCIDQSDCDESNPDKHTMKWARADADGDTHCFGSAEWKCLGDAAPMGLRFPDQCNSSNDCNDHNVNAGPVCIIPAGFATTFAAKSCVATSNTDTFTVSPTSTCPVGFSMVSVSAFKISGGGTCTATSPTTLEMTCNGLEGALCQIVGSCVAL